MQVSFESVRDEIAVRLKGPGVDELLLNGSRAAFVVRRGIAEEFPSPFADDFALAEWLQELAERDGVRLDPVNGAAGGPFDDGTARWHAVLPPLSRDGPLATFRRHRFGEVGIGDFADPAGLAPQLLAAFRARGSFLIAGPTASGKTTLLAALLALEPLERSIVIEALPELPRVGPRAIRLAERPASIEGADAVPLPRLVREALRLRPDRLALGEIRGEEADAFLEAAGTGHGGVWATIHADTVQGARDRLVLLAGRTSRARALAREMGVIVLARGSPPRLAEFSLRSATPDG